MSRIVRNDPYLTREDTGADQGRSPAIQHYEKQDGSDGATSNTVFTLSKPYVQGSNTLMVFINGQKAELLVSASNETEYEETSSSTITFGASLLDTDVVEFMIVGTYFIQDTDIYVTKSLEKNPNIIINGDFDIWQRGTSFAAIANGTYTADRFSYHKVGDMVHTVSRDTDVPTQAESGHKSSYSLKVDCTTVDSSIAAGDYCSISHKLEGYSMQAIMGNWATISFWVKATKTGIYCFAMRNSAGDKTWISEYTVSVSDTWEKKTITVNFSDSSGTWLYTNGVGLICTWALATGSTFQSTADSWLATNDWATSNQVNACDNTANNFLLSQVKMEEGETATPYRSRLFSEELALCQRYFQKAIDDDMFAGYAYSTTQAFITIPFKVTLRAEPSTTFVVPTDIRVWYNSDQGTCTSASVNLTSVESVNVIVVCSAAPFTQGDGVLGFINGSAEIWFDAEL